MNNKFSENLKKIRKDNNLSQEQLADELGVSRQAISKWESAVAYPEMDKIISLCTKFNLNIDDLLNKDIREIKNEEESKKNLNEYIDGFLKFITNTINMFSNMNFKSKCKCLFEQIVIATILFVLWLIIGVFFQDLLSGVFGLIPDKIYFVLHSILHLVYSILALIISIVIIIHIFKTRYLDYYEKIKKEIKVENESKKNNTKKIEKEEKTDKNNNMIFKKNEEKIIIRDPKHSEYKFINGLFKVIVTIIKFFTLCFSTILFVSLIFLFVAVIISFLFFKTGILFIGLLSSILSASVINIILILLLLNFVFNRKNNKKKMIWSFIISLIMFGMGIGLVLIGTLSFDYIENDKSILKTDVLEIDMKSDLTFEHYPNIEYIESNNRNIKIEYTINKYCDIKFDDRNSNIYFWSSCENPIDIVKEVINKINDKKIISLTNEINDIKLYTTRENINILKNNYNKHNNIEIQTQNIINSYEKKLSDLYQKINEYNQKEWDYKNEINNLKEQINNCNEY